MKKTKKVASTSSNNNSSRQPTERKGNNSSRQQKEEKKEKKIEFQFPELEEIKNGFDDFDVKNEGKISSVELCRSMKEMKLDEKYPYLYSIFNEIESDISYEELIDILNKKMEEANKQENLKKLFDFLLEESGGDKLPWQTFVKMARELNEDKTESELRQLLKLSGCSGEEINFEEFCTIMAEGGLDK